LRKKHINWCNLCCPFVQRDRIQAPTGWSVPSCGGTALWRPRWSWSGRALNAGIPSRWGAEWSSQTCHWDWGRQSMHAKGYVRTRIKTWPRCDWTHSVLGREEALLFPPAVPLSLHIPWTVGIRQWATQVLLLPGRRLGTIHGSLFHLLGALLQRVVFGKRR